MVLQGRERRAHSGRETKRVRWGNASGENTGPAQKSRGFQGRERGLLPSLCRLWGRKRGRQGTEVASGGASPAAGALQGPGRSGGFSSSPRCARAGEPGGTESVCREQQTCRRAAERRTEAPRSSAREPAGTAGRGPAGRGHVGLDDPLPPRLNLSPSSIFEKLGKERKRKGNCSHGKGG